MKQHKDFTKVIKVLQEDYGYSNLETSAESHKELINDVILAVENLKK